MSKEHLKKAGRITLFITKWTIIFMMLGGFLVFGAGVGYVAALVRDDEVRSQSSIIKKMEANAITSFAFFNDDEAIGQLRSEEDRRLAELGEIPQLLKDAVIAIEDNDFYEHKGVDFNGLVRAVKQKVMNEEVQTGGSTITQQVARRVFLSLDKADSRKAKEILLSLRLERILSKDQILLAYLNKIPYGNGSSGYNLYGIKAAAKGIFNIDNLSDLNLAQAAYLAGIPQQPSVFSAYTSNGSYDEEGFDKAVVRMQLVLKRMLEENKITDSQYQEALAFDLKATRAEPQKKAYATYPFLMMEVEREASEILVKMKRPELNPQTNAAAYNEAIKAAKAELLRSGYQVYTTIDKSIYTLMQEIAQNSANFTKDDPVKGIEQIGAIMINNKTGAILGMMEGRDFNKEQINHATQTQRQPGSTMKPIAAYLPAIDKGALAPATAIDDFPIILPDGQKGVHIPQNWNTDFQGLVSARRALEMSLNIPAIKLYRDTVGIDQAWSFAKKLGITTIHKDDYFAGTGVIGGMRVGVSVEELTNAYAAIGNKGIFNDAYFIRKITDTEGHVIYEHKPEPRGVFTEETAYLMTDMLKGVISSPYGTAPDLRTRFKNYSKVPVAGKTGSTQDDGDAWFMGYSPDISVGVWAGYDKPQFKLSKATGGTARAKNIWALIMDGAIAAKPDLFPTKQFAKPPKIVQMTVSSLSGKLPNELVTQAGKVVTDIFNKDFAPKDQDNVMVQMKIINHNGQNFIPHASTPEEFTSEKIVIKREKSVSQIMKELEVAMQKLPEDKRVPLEEFIPLDSGEEAPSETDPRTDDGKVPTPPVQLLVTQSGGNNVLTFQGSTSTDVVGYRVYRSANKGPFVKVKSLTSEQETRFEENGNAGTVYGYYVTAVDVAGKESPRGREVYTDGKNIDFTPITNADTGSGIFPIGTPGLPGSTDTKPDKPTGTDNAKAPEMPTGLTAKRKDSGVQLSWKPGGSARDVKSYNVYYSETANGEFKKLASLAGTDYYHGPNIKSGYYQVSAVNSNGESKRTATVKY